MTIGVGIELGESAVRGAVVERRGSGARLTATAEVPCASVAELPSALQQLRKSLGASGPAVIGIPTSVAILAIVQPLVVQRDRAQLAVQFELQQYLPYDGAQAAWHAQWLARNGLTVPALVPALVAATKRSVLDERLEACRRAGVPIQAVTVGGVGAINLWIGRGTVAEATSRPAVLLRQDGPLLEWLLITSASVQIVSTTVADAGGSADRVVDAVAEAWAGLRETFEPSPQGGGTALASSAPPVMTAGVAARAAVWIYGDERLTALRDRLAQAMDCDVHALDPSKVMGIDASRAPHPERFVVACGLAWQGLGAASLPINLQGERDALRRVDSVKRIAWAVSAVSAAAAMGLAAHVMLTTLSRKQDALQVLMKQEQTYQSLRPEIRALTAKQSRVAHRLDQLMELSRRHSLVPDALERMIEALPDEVWLTKAELTKADDALTGGLEGHSLSFQGVTKLMDQLKSGVGWSIVKPLATTVTADQASGKELITFAVHCEQPLPLLTDETAGSAPAGETSKGDASKSSRPKPPAKSKAAAKPADARSGRKR